MMQNGSGRFGLHEFERTVASPYFRNETQQISRWQSGGGLPGPPLAFSPDQHADDEQVEKVGADADGKRGRIIAEMIVQQPGHPAAGGHASAAEQ